MKKYLIILMLIAVLPLSFHSCQEEIVEEVVPTVDTSELSAIEKRFLDPGNLKSADNELKTGFIAEVLEDIERQNKADKFIENLVEKYGYPDWEMTRFFSDEEQTVAQVAVSHDNSCETEAVILCVKHKKKLKYRLFVRDKLDRFKGNKKPTPTFEKIKDLFIIFDFQKYGESSLLPDGYIEADNSNNNELKSVSYMMEIPTCYFLIVSSGGEILSARYECEYEYVWVYSSGSGGGSTSYYIPWFDEYNGGSGTSSVAEDNCNCDICPICKGCLNRPISLKSIPKPSEGGGETTVDCPMCSCPKIDISGIKDNDKVFCIYENLIKTAATEYNPLVTSFLMNFSDDLSINPDDIIFELEPLNGYGECDASGDKYVITLNSNEIDNRAPIEIAKTFIHEILHALIANKLDKSPDNFISDFREYIGDDGTVNSHQLMMNHYVNPMVRFLKDYDSLLGRNASYSYYQSLALSGLEAVISQEEMNNLIEAQNYFRQLGLTCD